jgi:chromosome segregation ATPase
MSDTNRTNVINRNDSERNNNSSKLQNSGDSTIIRRTLVERGLRPVNDENIKIGQSSTLAAITTINQQHKDEQRELQELNKKFANYLDRVQYLEDYNQRLIDDLNTIKETWGGDATALQAKYGPQLKTLRNEIDNALRDHALQELQLKRHEYDLWQIQQQIAIFDDDEDINRLNFLKQELDASDMEIELLKNLLDQRLPDLSRYQILMDNLLKELNGLKNELDTHQLERIILETELQTLKEHTAFQNSIHQAQRKQLLSLSKYIYIRREKKILNFYFIL